MSARFIVRVDDIGQGPEQHMTDADLEYFRSWWDAGGWGAEPVYLGVVAGVIGPREIERLNRLETETEAVVALHGWGHEDRTLDPFDVERGMKVFPKANCVIPPYNKYDMDRMPRLMPEHKPVLFGGFDGEHHGFGPKPTVINGWLHLSANRGLYAHSYRLIETVGALEDPGYPFVVTLHHRWDFGRFSGVRKLREALQGKIVGVGAAWPNS